jgi:hypothetical protein
MIKPEAIAAIAKAPAVTIAMLTLGSVATSRAEPAKYTLAATQSNSEDLRYKMWHQGLQE